MLLTWTCHHIEGTIHKHRVCEVSHLCLNPPAEVLKGGLNRTYRTPCASFSRKCTNYNQVVRVSERRLIGTFRSVDTVKQNVQSETKSRTVVHALTNHKYERALSNLEEVLGCCTSWTKTEWDTILPVLHSAWNNSKKGEIYKTPFVIEYRLHSSTISDSIQYCSTTYWVSSISWVVRLYKLWWGRSEGSTWRARVG